MKCFKYCKIKNKNCNKQSCRYWISSKESNNCSIICAGSEKSLTLEDIGKIFKVTRMRVCQIEKRAIQKLKNMLDN